LSWSARAKLSELKGSVNLVPESGGGAAFVVLRLPEGCFGGIEFEGAVFGPKQLRSFSAATTTAAPLEAANPEVKARFASLAADFPADGDLSRALADVYEKHRAQWSAALAAGIPDQFLDPIRKAISEHAFRSALAALSQNPND
jgi:hypothetical protein